MILAIETSGAPLSVALAHAGAVTASCAVHAPGSHDALLVPLVEDLLRTAGVGMADLDGVAVSEGPGSYTGLRIGMAAAKGIALGLGIPLAAVGTFDAMAFMAARTAALDDGRVFAPCMDARGGDVFAALYDAADTAADDGLPHARSAAAYLSAAAFAAQLPGGALLAGTGAPQVAALRPGAFRVHAAPALLAGAEAVALLGARMIALGRAADLDACEPRYLRAFEAKRARPLFDIPSTP